MIKDTNNSGEKKKKRIKKILVHFYHIPVIIASAFSKLSIKPIVLPGLRNNSTVAAMGI